MQFMAEELENKRPPANVMAWVRKMDFRRSINRRGGNIPAQQNTAKTSAPKKISVGRNDPCPCGSGKKYKNCCLKRNLPLQGA
jgi:preprotein translocase subunit SecA